MARKLYWCALLALCAGSLFADTPGAMISGSVRDSSGGAIQGAIVETREVARTRSRAAFRHLRSACIPFVFRGGEAAWADCSSGDEIRIDLTLPLKGQSESVIVTETTPLTDVESAVAWTVVNQRAIQDLPSGGRQLLRNLEASVHSGVHVAQP